MVTYIRSLIGLAKKSPPEADPVISNALKPAPLLDHCRGSRGGGAWLKGTSAVPPRGSAASPLLPGLLVGEEDSGKLVSSTKEAEF